MKAAHDEFRPTFQLDFQLKDGKQVLCQMWVTPLGLIEWRPIPLVELGPQRKAAVAGYLEDDDEDS